MTCNKSLVFQSFSDQEFLSFSPPLFPINRFCHGGETPRTSPKQLPVLWTINNDKVL